MRSSTLLCLTVAALLPAVAAVQARIVTDVNATLRRGEPGLKPNAACASTDDPAQCAALVDLYKATNGDKWTRNKGWLSGSSYCDWFNNYIPMCDDSGNVKYLWLPNNKLAGTISESLGNLKSLRKLSLPDNQLAGTIPDSLGNLKSLQAMNLFNNQLNGSIPDSLGNLTSLTVLGLSSNQLTGTIPSSICPLLVTGFVQCSLSNNDFSCPLPCATAKICTATCT